MKYKIEVDKFGNYIIKSTTEENSLTWEEAVDELIRLHNIRMSIWKDYN